MVKNKFQIKNIFKHQIAIPLIALIILIIVNAVKNPAVLSIMLETNAKGYPILNGQLIVLLSQGAELALLAIGMTLVTAASGGQDISVGAGIAVAGSTILAFVRQPDNSIPLLVVVLIGILAAMAIGLFNGFLVSYFKIQPMIATLIMFTAGRSIAAWINNNELPVIVAPEFGYWGNLIPGCPIPTPIIITAVCLIITGLVLKFTNLKLYVQSVGINQAAARLNGLNPTIIKISTYVILGVFVGIAAFVNVSRSGTINYGNICKDIEMDAILAVAMGGNSLGGGKFSIWASVIGAYVIQLLTQTLYLFGVDPMAMKAYKAIVVILLVVISAPKVKEAIGKVFKSKNKEVA